MRPQQRRAWERHYNTFVLPVPRAETTTSVQPGVSVDLEAAFGRSAPLIVEIGPGTGDSLVPMAQARPSANILAFEVYQPAIASTLAQLAANEVRNVRIVEADAVAGFRFLLPHATVDCVWLFFPDPWQKARHHKRRLLTTSFADLVASRMRQRGVWRLATDWEDYAGRIREVLDDHPAFANEHPKGVGTAVGSAPDDPLREAGSRRRPPYLRSRVSPGLSSLRALAAGHCLRRHRLLRLGNPAGPPDGSR
jgi:tRNA (guanine-N7-)-methyltransferase